jgi:hypothetical protein
MPSVSGLDLAHSQRELGLVRKHCAGLRGQLLERGRATAAAVRIERAEQDAAGEVSGARAQLGDHLAVHRGKAQDGISQLRCRPCLVAARRPLGAHELPLQHGQHVLPQRGIGLQHLVGQLLQLREQRLDVRRIVGGHGVHRERGQHRGERPRDPAAHLRRPSSRKRCSASCMPRS